MAIIATARTALRSAATSSRSAATSSKHKMASTYSPFRNSSQKPISSRFFRSPVEMSFAVQSMLPYHTATVSALLNSMLTVAPSGYSWMIEGD